MSSQFSMALTGTGLDIVSLYRQFRLIADEQPIIEQLVPAQCLNTFTLYASLQPGGFSHTST